MKRGTVLAALGVPVLAAAIVGLVPSARAEVADTVGGWIGVRTESSAKLDPNFPMPPDGSGVVESQATIIPAEPPATATP